MHTYANQITQQQPERLRPMFGLVAGIFATWLLGATVVAFGAAV